MAQSTSSVKAMSEVLAVDAVAIPEQDPLRIPAATFNTFVDAARSHGECRRRTVPAGSGASRCSPIDVGAPSGAFQADL